MQSETHFESKAHMTDSHKKEVQCLYKLYISILWGVGWTFATELPWETFLSEEEVSVHASVPSKALATRKNWKQMALILKNTACCASRHSRESLQFARSQGKQMPGHMFFFLKWSCFVGKMNISKVVFFFLFSSLTLSFSLLCQLSLPQHLLFILSSVVFGPESKGSAIFDSERRQTAGAKWSSSGLRSQKQRGY